MADRRNEAETAAGDDDIIDMTVFEQLLEIDDDDDREFSKGLAQQYVEQADHTFKEMDEALAAKNLDKLSKLGHFLKGSSSSVGLQAVSKLCAYMQNYGSMKDSSGTIDFDNSDQSLKACEELLPKLKQEQARAKKWLEDFYKEKW